MSLHYFLNTSGTRQQTSRLFEFYGKTLDVDTAYIDERLTLTNKDKTESINFIYDNKGDNGSFFINKDGDNCDFQSKEQMFPELQNIDKAETIENETIFRGKLIVDDFVLRDGTNLKDYIDQQIAQVYASVGGTVNTLTSGGNEEEIAPSP